MAVPQERTIFIVDDDEAVRESLKVLVESHGMQAETFASTEALVQGYHPHGPACLILDQHLQGTKSGLEFLASPERTFIQLPVILVTGRGDRDIERRALDAGVTAYLDKPIEAGRLFAAIDRAIAATC